MRRCRPLWAIMILSVMFCGCRAYDENLSDMTAVSDQVSVADILEMTDPIEEADPEITEEVFHTSPGGTTGTETAEVPVDHSRVPESDMPILRVSDATVQEDASEAVITVTLENNVGIIGMTLFLEYDENAMTLVKVEKGEALSELTFTEPKDLAGGCRFPWDGVDVSPENITNGIILVLTFRLSEKASSGSYDLKLGYDRGAIIDNDLQPLAPLVYQGSITIR